MFYRPCPIDIEGKGKLMEIERDGLCWCGSGLAYEDCHRGFDEKWEEMRRKGFTMPARSLIKNPKQIESIRESAKINIAVLDYVAEHIGEGTTTGQIDQWVYHQTTSRGAIPAPLNYNGFPKSVCTSVNEEVCHGIPSDEVILKSGDIVNVDASTVYKGFFSDSSRMFMIGQVSEEKRRLVQVAKECVEKGLRAVKPWGFLGDMAQAVYDHARANGYSVVRQIGGHGIGLAFHESPWVGYVGRRGSGMVMAPGMVFTIEPMINMGRSAVFQDEANGWTIYTRDGMPSAQWEIQVAVTEQGAELLSD